MKICFVTPEFVTENSCFDGGLANYLYRLSFSLIELGHEPLVVVSSDRTGIIEKDRILIHRVKVFDDIYLGLTISNRWLYQSLILNQYVEKLSSVNTIDIIQYTSYTATALFRRNDIPAVSRISSWNPLITKYYDSEVSDESMKCDLLELIALKNTDNIFGPSRIEAEYISNTKNVPVKVIESPFIWTNNSFDYSLYDRYLKNKKFLLFFGTLGVLKGLLTISEIIYDLLNTHEDLFFVFVGKDVGCSSGSFHDILMQKSEYHKDRIIYFERQKHVRLFPLIEKSIAVVLPSRIDNFPNSCIESMAHGKIVIGTRNTGFEQLIKHGESGFLIERDNPAELLITIDKVLALDQKTLGIISNNAIERIKKLQPEIVVNELLCYYKDVINGFNSSNINNLTETGIYRNFCSKLADYVKPEIDSSWKYFMCTVIKSPVRKVLERLKHN